MNTADLKTIEESSDGFRKEFVYETDNCIFTFQVTKNEKYYPKFSVLITFHATNAIITNSFEDVYGDSDSVSLQKNEIAWLFEALQYEQWMADVFPATLVSTRYGLFGREFDRGITVSRAANENGYRFLIIRETTRCDFMDGKVFIPDRFKPLLRVLLRKAQLLM